MKQIGTCLQEWNSPKARAIRYCEVVKRNLKRDMADYADMFAAIGAEPRLQILRLLLGAHPNGMVVGDILAELKTAPSTLSHHLEKLKHEGLVDVRRDTKFLWYTANTDALQDLIGFLYSECCARSSAVKPDKMIDQLCKCDKPHAAVSSERSNGSKR
jgi:DNA-binding transcriptional ArsR family regulator